MRTMQVSRERTIFRRPSATGTPEETAIGSNRMVVLLPRGGPLGSGDEQTFVIRCWSLPATLRMAACMMNSLARYGSIIESGAIQRWSNDWINQLSQTDRARLAQNWIVVYYRGRVLYATGDQPEMNAIERAAMGAEEIDAEILDRAADLAGGEGARKPHIEHDSMVAFDMEDQGWGVRVEIFDRNLGEAGKIQFTLVRRGNEADRWGVPLAGLRAASFMVEAAALVGECNRLIRARASQAADKAQRIDERLGQISERVRDLQGRLDVIAEGNGLNMTTERPNYIAELEMANRAV